MTTDNYFLFVYIDNIGYFTLIHWIQEWQVVGDTAPMDKRI